MKKFYGFETPEKKSWSNFYENSKREQKSIKKYTSCLMLQRNAIDSELIATIRETCIPISINFHLQHGQF